MGETMKQLLVSFLLLASAHLSHAVARPDGFVFKKQCGHPYGMGAIIPGHENDIRYSVGDVCLARIQGEPGQEYFTIETKKVDPVSGTSEEGTSVWAVISKKSLPVTYDRTVRAEEVQVQLVGSIGEHGMFKRRLQRDYVVETLIVESDLRNDLITSVHGEVRGLPFFAANFHIVYYPM